MGQGGHRLEFPTSGTYYWQVKTYTGTEADDGAWWSVTVTAPPLFTKVAPTTGASGLGTEVTLQWTTVPNEGYWVCWDTTDNTTCDTMWWPSPVPSKALSDLAAGTYSWQVKTAGGGIEADNGAWAHFSVAATALFTKQAPGNGATGLGSTVTLSWSSVPDEGYYVCWDTTDNNTCDTTWWPTAAGTSRVVEGPAAGTYYWQVHTAGGNVLADNGTWYTFTVSGTPAAAASPGAPPTRADGLWALAGLASLGGLVVLAGASRRRRIVVAGVVVGVLGPVTALAQTTTQVIEYYSTDAIGSVRAVTRQVNGQWQVTRHDFLPFGEEVAPQNPPQDKQLFTGKERDSETGLDYFGARYYRANLGRFTTVDPAITLEENLVDPQKWNRYAYVRNNPWVYADPDGRELRTTELARMQDIAGAVGSKLALKDGRLDVSAVTPADLKDNEGATLLYQMATSSYVYSYSEGSTIETAAGPRPVEGAESNLNDRPDSRYSYRPGGAKLPAELPPAGVNASVVINPRIQLFEDPTGKPVSTSAVAFHELAEAHATIDGGQQYLPMSTGAHATAAARERILVAQRPTFTQGLAGGPVRR